MSGVSFGEVGRREEGEEVMKPKQIQKQFPVPICQSAIDGLSDIEKIFIPSLVRKGKIKIVPDRSD